MFCSRVKTELSGEENALVQARDGSGLDLGLKIKQWKEVEAFERYEGGSIHII